MTATTAEYRSTLVGPLVVGLLVAAVLSAGATGVAVASDGASTVTPAGNDSSAPRLDSVKQAQIDDQLQTADGHVRAVVRFSEDSPRELSEMRTQGQRIERLQSQANRTQATFRALAEQRPGLRIERQFWLTNAVLVSVDTDRIPLEQLTAVDDVQAIHQNRRVELSASSTNAASTTVSSAAEAATARRGTNTQPDTTYGPAQIRADDAWTNYDTRGEEVRVAVLDTGIDTSHSDLSLSNPRTDWAEFNDTGAAVQSQPFDDHGHGTAVSGIVAGGALEGQQYGIAPEVELLHARVLDPSGTFAQVVAGMEWAVEQDADVITMSLGTPGFYEAFVDPIRNAKHSGAIVVSAAGNQGPGVSNAPGNVYDAVAVGASNQSGGIWSASGGERIDTQDVLDDPPDDWPEEYVVPDLTAPGVEVTSAYPTTDDGRDRYVRFNGTSMAAPHVAGAIALVKSATKTTENAAIRRALTESARTPGEENQSREIRYGSGIVDVTTAIEQFDGTVAGTVTDTTTGRPVENAAITVRDDDSVVMRTRTNETGQFQGSVLQGRYNLSITAPGYERTVRPNLTITANNRTTADALLTGTALINGTIVDVNTDTPIANATVTATSDSVQYNATTDRNGTYAVGPIGAVDQSYELNVTAPGYNTTTIGPVTVSDNETVLTGGALSGTGSITGTVRSATNESSLSNATVTATTSGRTYVDTVLNNTYTITGVPAIAETYTVNAVATAFRTNSTAVSVTGNGTVQDFLLTKFGRYLEVTDVDAPDTIEATTSYTVEATVSNRGTDTVTETVSYTVAGQSVRNETVELDPGTETTVIFEYTVPTAGAIQHGIETGNESTTRSLTVDQADADADDAEPGSGGVRSAPPSGDTRGVQSGSAVDSRLAVSETTISQRTLDQGEEFLISVTIHNSGFAPGTDCFKLRVGNQTIDSVRLTIDAGESRTIERRAAIDHTGQFDVTVLHEQVDSNAHCGGTARAAGTITVTATNDSKNRTVSQQQTSTGKHETTPTQQQTNHTDSTTSASTTAADTLPSSDRIRRNVSKAGLAAIFAALLSMIGLRSRRW